MYNDDDDDDLADSDCHCLWLAGHSFVEPDIIKDKLESGVWYAYSALKYSQDTAVAALIARGFRLNFR